MDEGQFARWLKEDGQAVTAGEPLFAIESDKAMTEIEALEDGMLHVLTDGPQPGDTVKVGQVIGHLLADGESPPTTDAAVEVSAMVHDHMQPVAAGSGEPARAVGLDGTTIAGNPALPTPLRRTIISPRARRVASEIGVDVSTITGTGRGGRIRERDVRAAATTQSTPATQPAVTLPPLPDFATVGPVKRHTLSPSARHTALHMATCWANVPHFTVHQYVDATELENVRQLVKAAVEQRGGKLTVTALLAKLVAAGLQQHPLFNASYDGARQEIIYRKYYHLGLTVDTPRGLAVPVIRDTDRKSLSTVAHELHDLATRARDGQLTPDDTSGGTFTITNLGGIGCGFFTPVVNWPEVAILGVGTAAMQIQYHEGQARPRLMLPLSLSIDHRVITSADAARFLTWLRQAIERPLSVLLT